ncbi:hypothetical protein MTsPCn9_12980 [Croceitalea sp. MTPC9]|uniref:hypothetical protein n=1 Tax=unclassified Croceitalea TaxID=2632280 RepID=UPI002B3EF1F7|nr:hypothetical protein MTsPCn6_16150 [Croceitalea sp. MTPC6]GMN16362.1 hypothetical protein MTsPCn9_12980 [Croceitalea sp. MTPC9]
MKKKLSLLCLFICSFTFYAQDSVDIDGRLQPLLNEFFEYCDTYGIEYHEKLFQLKNIDVTNSLPLEEGNTVMGMVTRDANGDIENILINWIALIDPEIFKVVAFHEFAHHFLDYKHTCPDCDEIMAVNNASYFNVARDWDNQVKKLFVTSPIYLAKQAKVSFVQKEEQEY